MLEQNGGQNGGINPNSSQTQNSNQEIGTKTNQNTQQERLRIHLQQKLAYQQKYRPEGQGSDKEGGFSGSEGSQTSSTTSQNLESKMEVKTESETEKQNSETQTQTRIQNETETHNHNQLSQTEVKTNQFTAKEEKLNQPKNLIQQPYFLDGNFCLFEGDCVEIMKQMPDNYVDMIFADPPYFLSEKDKSRQPTNFPVIGTNYKGEWDVSNGFVANLSFHHNWVKEARRVLKSNGTIWITGTHHSIYQCGFCLQNQQFKILNEISWYKAKSRYYTKSYFNFSHESIIWARKSKNPKDRHHFNAGLMNKWRGDPLKDSNPENSQSMRTVWQIDPTHKKEFIFGRHPTQKPIQLLQRMILASTKPNAIILDPFNGSGTTGIAIESVNQALQKAGKLEDLKQGRKYIGIDREGEYLELTKRRLEEGGGRKK